MLLDEGRPFRAGASGERTGGAPAMDPSPPEEKQTLTVIERFRVPIGGQEIELQQLDYVHGGMSLLRLRIREGKRFTIFDIDPVTARHWGQLMQQWSERVQPADGGEP